jgi:hypothetical protein
VKEEHVEDLWRQYPDEWIVYEVTRMDKFGQPTHGILLAHTPDKVESQRIRMELSQQGRAYAVAFTGDVVPETKEFWCCKN